MSRCLLLSRLVVRGVESPYLKHLAHSKGGCSDPVHCLSSLQPTGEEKGPGRVRASPAPSPFPPPSQQGAGSELLTLFSSYSALEVETEVWAGAGRSFLRYWVCLERTQALGRPPGLPGLRWPCRGVGGHLAGTPGEMWLVESCLQLRKASWVRAGGGGVGC